MKIPSGIDLNLEMSQEEEARLGSISDNKCQCGNIMKIWFDEAFGLCEQCVDKDNLIFGSEFDKDLY